MFEKIKSFFSKNEVVVDEEIVKQKEFEAMVTCDAENISKETVDKLSTDKQFQGAVEALSKCFVEGDSEEKLTQKQRINKAKNQLRDLMIQLDVIQHNM